MLRSSLRSRVAVTTLVLAACAVTFLACGGDDPAAPAPSGADASTSQTPNPDPQDPDPPAPTDAGPDGEVLADGGDLPEFDLDGGDDDGDGGVDAGSGCATLTPGPYIDSTCASLLTRIQNGGALVTATYELASVTVYGDAAFCSNSFKVYQHRGKLVVTASSPTTATFEFLDNYAPKATKGDLFFRFATTRYDVDVVSVTVGKVQKLTFTPTAGCPGKSPPPQEAVYSAGTNNAGKKTLGLTLPYGQNGSARYFFVEP